MLCVEEVGLEHKSRKFSLLGWFEGIGCMQADPAVNLNGNELGGQFLIKVGLYRLKSNLMD
jgi:hypothetical protein